MPERSQVIILHNNSTKPLTLVDTGLDHGIWTGSEPGPGTPPEFTGNGGTWTAGPPATIAPGGTAVWGSESSGFLTGTQGHATFTAPSTADDGGQVVVRVDWDVPFEGSDGLDATVVPDNFDPNFPSQTKTFSIAHVGSGSDYYQQGFFNWDPGETNPWDEFVVAGGPVTFARRYDAVWRPGTSAEKQYYGMQFVGYQKTCDKLWKTGWRVYRLNTYVENGKLLYDAVFRPGATGEMQAYQRTLGQLQSQYDDLWKKGWRLFLLNTYVLNGTVYYDAIWHLGTDGEMQAYGRTPTQFQAQYDDLWKKGWRIYILNATVVNGALLYDAIWRPGTVGEIQAYGRTLAQYQTQYDDLWKKGWRLYSLNVYVVNGQLLRDAVWRPGTEGEMQLYEQTFAQYQPRYADLWKQNWRIELLRSYEVPDSLNAGAQAQPALAAE